MRQLASTLGVRNPPMHFAAPVECDVPSTSALQPKLVAAAYFRDSYRAPLTFQTLDIVDIFFSIFGHHPGWIKSILMFRNRIAKKFGLEVPADLLIKDISRNDTYKVGDIIGPWPIFSINENELVAGRDNSHLDFRLSVFRELSGGTQFVVVTTICVVHNWIGKVYLFFIVPFHRWGVKYIISRALRAGRL